MNKEEAQKLYEETIKESAIDLVEMLEVAQAVKGDGFCDFALFTARLLRLMISASIDAEESTRKQLDILFWSMLGDYSVKCNLTSEETLESYKVGFKLVEKSISATKVFKDKFEKMGGLDGE